jgi:hypothetical protein
MAQSRQFEYLQKQTLQRLRVRIPANCPIAVTRLDRGGFDVMTTDGRTGLSGRFQVVAAWIDGFVASWKGGYWEITPS